MNTIPIRIKIETRGQLDALMKQYTLNVFSENKDSDKIKSITKKGLSYGEFIEVLIDSYCKHK